MYDCSQNSGYTFRITAFYFIMPPTVKKLVGHIAFGLFVCSDVRHFNASCNF